VVSMVRLKGIWVDFLSVLSERRFAFLYYQAVRGYALIKGEGVEM
jgi:hypothetical protein